MKKGFTLVEILFVLALISIVVLVGLSQMKGATEAAHNGYRDAQYNLGVFYRDGQYGVIRDVPESVKWFKKAAAQGDVTAQFNLGVLYANGSTGLKRDFEEASKWFLMASENGDPESQYNVGLLYYNGNGLPQSKKNALKYWEMSGEAGYEPAKKAEAQLCKESPWACKK